MVIRGLGTEVFAFTRAVGKWSRAQVVGFILLMIFSTSCLAISGKHFRGWEIASCECTVGVGCVEDLGKEEWIESIFVLKKCFYVSEGSVVEYSCLESPVSDAV